MKENAFNQQDNEVYGYGYDDLNTIGNYLFEQLRKQRLENVIYANPLGAEIGQANINVDRSAEELEKFTEDLESNKKGLFNVGGNHLTSKSQYLI